MFVCVWLCLIVFCVCLMLCCVCDVGVCVVCVCLRVSDYVVLFVRVGFALVS